MKTCRDRFLKIMSVSRYCASVCGADILRLDYRMNYLTYFCIGLAVFFFGCTGYTIYMGCVVDGDWTVLLQAMCMAGSAIQGMFKLFFCVCHKKLLQEVQSILDNIYIQYEQERQGYRLVLNKVTSSITKWLKFVSGLYIFCVCIMTLYPMFVLVVHKKKIFVMQFLLPGIDPTTDIGHLIHLTSHMLGVMFGAFGNFAGDMFMFVFIGHVPLFRNILRLKFHDLNDVLLETHDSQKTLPRLRDIFNWHQLYGRIVDKIGTVYRVVIFVQIFTSSFGICCTLFSLYLGVWPAAPSYLLYTCFILYAYCGAGTLVEVANDGFVKSIYNDCLWYELSVMEQKMIIIMLMKTQNAAALTVGDIMPLAVTTGLQLTKAIYSYMMMLMNFVSNEREKFIAK